MRSLRFSLLSLATLLLLGGCTAVNEPTFTLPNSTPSAAYRAYFYPLKNGLQYTYIRTTTDGGSVSTAVEDTVTYQLLLSNNKLLPNSLVRMGDKEKQNVLYNFTIGKDSDANAAILSDSIAKFYALRGSLEDGSSWISDSAHNIIATVFAHYDAYMLPDRKTSYNDVITIKYQGANPNEFCLRYFARDNGLILERYIKGGSTEVSNLRLVKVQNNSTLNRVTLPGSNPYFEGPSAARAIIVSPEDMK